MSAPGATACPSQLASLLSRELLDRLGSNHEAAPSRKRTRRAFFTHLSSSNCVLVGAASWKAENQQFICYRFIALLFPCP